MYDWYSMSLREGSNEGSQCMILSGNKKNIIIVFTTPNFFELSTTLNQKYRLYSKRTRVNLSYT